MTDATEEKVEAQQEAPVKEQVRITYEPTEREGQNNLAYWYPLLKQMRMRVPETIIVGSGDCELTYLLDGVKPRGFDQFIERLKLACHQVGYPVFLRTGMTSDKHDYERTCFVENKTQLEDHVRRLVETSVIANISGYPFDYTIWAVRKFIYTKEYFTYFNGNLPITKEVRYFIKDGDIVKSAPYWPEEVFENASDEEKALLAELRTITDDDKLELDLMARYIAKHMPGFWSVDFLQDRQGKWWCTDMAVGERSYGCPEEYLEKSDDTLADAPSEDTESSESEAIVGDKELIS